MKNQIQDGIYNLLKLLSIHCSFVFLPAIAHKENETLGTPY